MKKHSRLTRVKSARVKVARAESAEAAETFLLLALLVMFVYMALSWGEANGLSGHAEYANGQFYAAAGR